MTRHSVMRAYTRRRMSCQPRAGISDGVWASRPRSGSKPRSLRRVPAPANRCGRNPKSLVIGLFRLLQRAEQLTAAHVEFTPATVIRRNLFRHGNEMGLKPSAESIGRATLRNDR